MSIRLVNYRLARNILSWAMLLVLGIATTIAAQAADERWCVYPEGEGPGKGRHIVLISGDEEYRSEEALPMLGKILSQRHGFKCTVLFAQNADDGTINPNEQHNIPGMESLASADLIILALRYRSPSDDQMKFFVDYVNSGKPIIGLRTSTHAFNYPADSNSPYAYFGQEGGKWAGGFGKQVLGETWVSHHGNHKVESTRGVIVDENSGHPILCGVDDIWGPTDVYGIHHLPEGTTVLLRGQVLQGMQPGDPPVVGAKNDPMMPLAWVLPYQSESGKTARVFCTTMGASQDFSNEGLRRLVVNACYWCLALEGQISRTSDVNFVGPYEPTPFGFDGFQKGIRPADHALGNTPAAEVNDVRLGPLKTLDDHFPFDPPQNVELWQARSAEVRERILVAQGLFPLPARTPLNGVMHSRVDCGDYSIEKVYFESFPGFFVSGSLFRPKNKVGPFPGVLCPHGHWNNGRFYDAGPEAAAREIESGAEFELESARAPLQARCVHLARMGCVVFHYDMIGYADSQQITQNLAHGFSQQRPMMNSTDAWGLFSPQAESRLQSVMGLQTWSSIRALDLLESLPDVDRSRIAVTGASGGGTQTMILAAIDPRPSAIFPAVMVSTAMQGGCTCENAALLRIGTGNVEFASLFAPKPQGLSSADDWTKEMSRDGFPQLQSLYRLLGHPDNVRLCEHVEFGHNYNAVSRKAMYELFDEALHLNADVTERPFPRKSPQELSVWDAVHPQPTGGDDFERKLLQHWNSDSQVQWEALRPKGQSGAQRFKDSMKIACRAMFGRTVQTETVEWKVNSSDSKDGLLWERGRFVNASRGEQTPAILIRPQADWNSRYVICLSENGKAGVADKEVLSADSQRFLDAGYGVVGVDCYWQGELLPPGADAAKGRLVENGREAAGYTFGYNNAIFVCRVHDVLNAIAGLAHQPSTKVDLLALDALAPVGAAARALAGTAVQRAAIDTNGFRFAKVTDLRDVNFLPGGAKYGDVPALIALGSPNPLWLGSEMNFDKWIDCTYRAENAEDQLQRATSSGNALDWLIHGIDQPR